MCDVCIYDWGLGDMPPPGPRPEDMIVAPVGGSSVDVVGRTVSGAERRTDVNETVWIRSLGGQQEQGEEVLDPTMIAGSGMFDKFITAWNEYLRIDMIWGNVTRDVVKGRVTVVSVKELVVGSMKVARGEFRGAGYEFVHTFNRLGSVKSTVRDYV